jgi:replication factor C large subunit
MSWITKYAPKGSQDILQSEASKVRDFIKNYSTQKKKALLLYGPPGTCKSTSVYAIAAELGLEVIETNASDFRTKDKISKTVGSALYQQSLFFRGKVVLVDEVDGLSGTKDRGGIQEIVKLIAKSPFPLVCTANDPYHKKFKALRKAALMVEFAPLLTAQIQQVLENICASENIDGEGSILRSISRRSGGDLRAAINDLQSIAVGKTLSKDMLDSMGERNLAEELPHALLKVFKTKDTRIALSAYDSVTLDLDKIRPWVDENLPYEYKDPQALDRAYYCLSRADIFRRRIMRRQHWRYLVYINMLLSAGVALAKEEKNPERIEYKETRRFLKIWMAKMKYQKRNAIAEKIASQLHCSTKKAMHDILPYVRFMAKNGVALDFELDPAEVAWLAS